MENCISLTYCPSLFSTPQSFVIPMFDPVLMWLPIIHVGFPISKALLYVMYGIYMFHDPKEILLSLKKWNSNE